MNIQKDTYYLKGCVDFILTLKNVIDGAEI